MRGHVESLVDEIYSVLAAIGAQIERIDVVDNVKDLLLYSLS